MKCPSSPAAVAVLLVISGCGGSSTAPPVDTTTTTTPTTVNPVTTVSTPPSSTTGDPSASKCGSLPAGPVARYAISPREQRTNGSITDIRVRAKPGFDEVWCLDKDQDHRLDFNSNQRNSGGRECCWIDDPSWDFEDPDGIAQDGQSLAGTNHFNFRLRVNPRGKRGTVYVQAEIDGIKSYDWQSGSGYSIQPLRVVSMSKNEIERDCQCIFRGNGIYEGDRCPK
jgi:hypothetical protein